MTAKTKTTTPAEPTIEEQERAASAAAAAALANGTEPATPWATEEEQAAADAANTPVSPDAATEPTEPVTAEPKAKKARASRAKPKVEPLDWVEDTVPLAPQFFVVTDEPDTITVAAKLGLHDHSALNNLNGRFSGHNGVQPGQRLVLPAEYRFDGIDGVVTE